VERAAVAAVEYNPSRRLRVAAMNTFFALNHDLIQFAYGLAFFTLGLAIALHSRQHSRLQLASSLSWLAAFGFAHSFNEWGDLFIPIQAEYLRPPVVVALLIVQLMLLGASFACLMEFGITLLRPGGRWRWLHGLAVGLLMAWLLIIFFIVLPFLPDVAVWHHTANALARYGLALPAGLVAAYGLRQETFQRIAPLQVPPIVRTLRLAGLCLTAYALLAGLIPPPVPFFPGNLLNEVSFGQLLGLPVVVLRALVGLLLSLAIIRALEVFDVESERRVEAIEQQQILVAERERLARELHDGTIQNVYSVALIVDSAQRLAVPDSPMAERLLMARNVLNQTITDLRRSLGVLRGAPPTSPVEPLALALQRLADDPRLAALADVALELEVNAADTLPAEPNNHVIAVVSEALANAVRHGHATRVRIRAERADGRLRLHIWDNGTGGAVETSGGHGLRNMRERARLLGGELSLQSLPGRGTTVALDVPWNDNPSEVRP
jgi:signal transduction histidine kinase